MPLVSSSTNGRKIFIGPKGGQYVMGPRNCKIYIKSNKSNKVNKTNNSLKTKQTENKSKKKKSNLIGNRSTTKSLCHRSPPYKHLRTLGKGSFGTVSQVCLNQKKNSSIKAATFVKKTRKSNKKPQELQHKDSPSCQFAEKKILFTDKENETSFRKEVYYNALLQKCSKTKIAVELKAAEACKKYGKLVYELMHGNLKTACMERQHQLVQSRKEWAFLTKEIGKKKTKGPRKSKKHLLKYSVPKFKLLNPKTQKNDDDGDEDDDNDDNDDTDENDTKENQMDYNYDYDLYLIKESEIKRMFSLAYQLGQCGIIHGDLKVENFLISQPLNHKDSKIYLSDLGCAGDFAEYRAVGFQDLTLPNGSNIVLQKNDSIPVFGWARDKSAECEHSLLPPFEFRSLPQYHKNREQMWKDWMSYTNIIQLEIDLLTSHTFVLQEGKTRHGHRIASFLGVSLEILPKLVRLSFDRHCSTFISNVKQQLWHTVGILQKYNITSPAYILDKISIIK